MAPTITELEAGIDASCRINSADYNVTPAASETVEEKELCVEGNAVAFGPSNGTVEFTPFRYFDETGAPETGGVEGEIGDAVFQATKEGYSHVDLPPRDLQEGHRRMGRGR